MEPISATLAQASSPPAPVPQQSGTTLDKDAFLKLLVAQLKYQDPTAPTDVSQMMQQTSALSMVERLDQIAAGIDALGGGAPLTSAAGMLGREVTFDIGSFAPVTATVDAVRLVDGQVILSAGGYDVPLEALVEVTAGAAGAGGVPVSTPTTPSTSPSPPSSGDDAGATSTGDGTSGGTGDPGGYDTPDF